MVKPPQWFPILNARHRKLSVKTTLSQSDPHYIAGVAEGTRTGCVVWCVESVLHNQPTCDWQNNTPNYIHMVEFKLSQY